MSRKFRALTEAQIRKAEAEGKLSNLPGQGKPLPDRPGDAFIDPGDAVGFRIMAEEGALPDEIVLARQLQSAREAYAMAKTPADKKSAMARIADLDLRHSIAAEARRKFLKY